MNAVMDGSYSKNRERRNTYIDLVRIPRENGPLGRDRLKLKDNINMNLREVSLWGCKLEKVGSHYG
jgi:hypothetical protein